MASAAGPAGAPSADPATISLHLLAADGSDASLADAAREIDAALDDALRDLGFTRAGKDAATTVRPSVVAADAGFVKVLLHIRRGARPEEIVERRAARSEVAVQAVALFREALRPSHPRDVGSPARVAPTERIAGRATLMASSTALGGLVGFSIQASSGSYDARLLVPLTLVGAGIGLGASYLASGEWEVGTGDAWFFTAGGVWGSAAGHLIFQGRFGADRADRDRWVFGLVGGGLGATLATLGITVHPMTDAGALLANAGGAGGLGLGALVEVIARRGTSQVPCSGMGYGAALGWLAAATIAVNVRPNWPGKHLARMPVLGVIGESRAVLPGMTSAAVPSAPIVGLGYGGSLDGLVGPFHL